tara:strand:+ start:281 stop:1165 length:885 start_codon:yes stop_codon:yes gene_type:complete
MAFKQTVSFLDLKSTVTFTDINGLVQYVNLSAVDVILDAFSKDLFFLVGHPNALILSITDSVDVITFSKVLADTPVLEEQAAIGFTLATQTESVSMGDNLVFFRKNFERSFTEAISLVDTASNDDPLTTDWSTGIGHSTTLSESSAFALSTPASDSMTMSETSTTAFAKVLADTPSVSETLAHSFTKAIADSYSISEAVASSFAKPVADTSSVSETLARNFSKSLSDSATISETLAASFAKALADTPSVSEALAYSFSTSAADSATMAESISVLHISGANSVLNASPLNTYGFN